MENWKETLSWGFITDFLPTYCSKHSTAVCQRNLIQARGPHSGPPVPVWKQTPTPQPTLQELKASLGVSPGAWGLMGALEKGDTETPLPQTQGRRRTWVLPGKGGQAWSGRKSWEFAAGEPEVTVPISPDKEFQITPPQLCAWTPSLTA